MRTHGHREGNIIHQGLLGGGAKGGIALEEIPNIDDRVMDTANNHGKCIAFSAHVPQNLKCNKKSKKKRKLKKNGNYQRNAHENHYEIQSHTH